MIDRFLSSARAGRLALLVCLLAVLPAEAQRVAPLDTTRVYELDALVVTADRSAQALSGSVAAVSLVSAGDLQRLPLLNLSDALQLTPGFTFLDLDGLGYRPQAVVRGFYGGGEAEYVQLLLDGRPLNEVERGLVNWNLVPLENLQAVEVLRGGASSLYGDAAVGGVINLVTRTAAAPSVRLSLEGGAFGHKAARAGFDARLGRRPFAGHAGFETTDGFRAHAARRAGTVGASAGLVAGPATTLTLSTLHHWQDHDEPGPLTGAQRDQDRRQSSVFYRFDHTDERQHRLALDGRHWLGEGAEVSGYVTGEVRQVDRVSTLVLAPVFADTKARDVETQRLQGTLQATLGDLPLAGRLVIGADASAGLLDTRYFGVLMGGADAYRNGSGARGALQAQGEAGRRMVAPFFQYDLYPSDRLRLTLGGRLDHLRDSFTPQGPTQGDEQTTTHTAFSPKAGVNVRLVSTARHVANVYANVSRSFKAPTLDQLYDQRTIPVPFPPFSISLSNGDLEPQYGTSYEVGLYHRAALRPDGVGAEVSLAAYHIDMRNELDFDLQTLSYTNLGKSLHRGIEAGLRLHLPRRVALFGNYAYQGVTLEYGDNDGKYVKAIPRDAYSAGISAAHRTGLTGSLVMSGAARIFLDDANTIDLPGYTKFDARLGYRVGRLGLSAEVHNLFDQAYDVTGYPDPAGSGVVYYYPAAGRYLRVGLRLATR